MADFIGTDSDDVIDATYEAGFKWFDLVFGEGGNDTVTLSPGVTFVSGPGNDIIIGIDGGGYACWFDPAGPYINLAEGWAIDGYGDIDQLSGITEIHLNGYGATVIGSDINEMVFYFGGDSYIDLGGGSDTLCMWDIESSEYDIRQAGTSVYLFGSDHEIEIRNVELIEFHDRTMKPGFREDDLFAEFQYEIYSFIEDQWSEGWWYAGTYNEPGPINYYPQAPILFDVNADGDLEMVVPLNKGYRTGVDTRMHFQIFENRDGVLTYNNEMTSETAFTSGARRSEIIHLDRYDSKALVTVAHDTAIETETRYDIPWRFGDITIMTAEPFKDVTSDLIPVETLPYSLLAGRNTAVDSHSLAVGDVNGDGMEDILVGEWSEPFFLLQTKNGYFSYETSDFLQSISGWVEPTLPGAEPALLLDLHLADFNGDGFDDLIVGWGINGVSRIFFNDGEGRFSLEHSKTLPVSVYGTENNMHLATFSGDFDLDGDLDLIVLNVRDTPYYEGNYLQFLENNGTGEFIDATNTRFGDPLSLEDTFGETWAPYTQVIDVNGDHALDIVSNRVTASNITTPLVYLNDGNGYFEIIEIPVYSGNPQPMRWGDFDNDGKMEFVSFNSSSVDSEGMSSIYSFDVYELSKSVISNENRVNVGGRIKDSEGRILEGVVVNESSVSDDRGIWEVGIASDSPTQLSFSKTWEPDSGPGTIDIGDAFAAFLIWTGILPLDEGIKAIKTIAADVDKNGVVSFLDVLDIFSYTLGSDSGHVGEYVFIDSNFDSNSINNVNYEKPIILGQPAEDLTIDMIGILLGDVNWF